MSKPSTARFRYSGALPVAGLIATISALPLASVGWAYAPVVLVPLAVTIWGWRAGTDADRRSVRVRALLGTRTVPWSLIEKFTADPRGRVSAVLTDGRRVPLTAVRTGDLPRLVAANGQDLATNPS